MVHPPLSYGTVHSSFSKGFRCMATKPALALPWSSWTVELSRPSIFSLSWTALWGSPLGDSIKVSVWCPRGLGKHGCDSEVLIHREGTLCQTLSARDPPGWGILTSLCGQGRSISSHRPHLCLTHSSLIHTIASIVSDFPHCTWWISSNLC